MSIENFLRARGVAFVSLLHRPAISAARLAHSLHVAGAQVAKAVLVRSPKGFALAVLPATCRIDLERLALALGAQPIELASGDEVESVFDDCEPGALPPFGRYYGIPTVVESRLAAHAEIVIGGKLRHEGMRIRFADYEAVERPARARFGVPIDRQSATKSLREAS
jgi:Ala-tRNA(Pro) deacylase